MDRQISLLILTNLYKRLLLLICQEAVVTPCVAVVILCVVYTLYICNKLFYIGLAQCIQDQLILRLSDMPQFLTYK
jgi:hypothetical protein